MSDLKYNYAHVKYSYLMHQGMYCIYIMNR